ncbi:ATP-binding protein, partial [Stenotrophomonas maltophilia]|uniref:ATP-binding protein n=2 Tax=Lysobacteraceae TaxID=32033 RepID=UPI00128D1DA5
IPPVLILLYVFVNRIVRPTTALTDAAERMSRGERIDPLSLQGPDEIREIARAFNVMHERTTRFVDERTRMLAAISHDLRTPLTSLELQAAMLPDSEERSELLRTLDEVRQMVNETLRFATHNARSEDSVVVELDGLLKEVCRRLSSMGHVVGLDAPLPVLYRCRPIALRRALDNLIVNALRHGQHVSVVLRDLGADGVCIDIADDGPGIAEDMLERVFEPFFQLDQARHRETGSSVGLGLATARDCVQAHGGHLELRNRTEGGLQARITLPAAHERSTG